MTNIFNYKLNTLLEKYDKNKKQKIMNILNINDINKVNNIIKKLNLRYNYYNKDTIIKLQDIKRIIKYFKNLPIKINYKDITHYNQNYNNGIIPSLYKLSALVYNKKLFQNISYLKKYFLYTNIKSLFSLLYFEKEKTLFIITRGTKYYSELKKLGLNSSRVPFKLKYKKTYNDFIIWKENYIKKYKKKCNCNIDVELPELQHKNLYVHSNYYKKSVKIIKKVNPIIDNLLNNKKLTNIILVGNSMGGSISIMTGIKIKELYRDKLKVHINSFSNVGIGNRNLSLFALYLNIDSYIRIYNREDLATKLKTSLFFKPFGRLRHINKSVPLKERNKYIIEDIYDNIYKDKKLIKNIDKIDKYKTIRKLYLNHVMYKFSKNKNAPIFI